VDSVGSNNGASTGAGETVSPTPAAGWVGVGQRFGANTGIDVPAHASFNWGATDSFSIECWVRGPAAAPTGTQVFLGRADTNLDLWLGIRKTTGFPVFRLETDVQSTLEGTTALDDVKFYHIVAVRDASANENRLYVNGDLEDSESITYTTAFASANPLNIGYYPGSHFVGTVDEVAIYSRALSAAEIEEHFKAGNVGNGIDTLVDLPDDGGNGGGDGDGGGGGGGGGCFIATIKE
jgi:hypothetical protein